MNPDTLAGAVEAAWNRWPDSPALVCGARVMTYAQLGEAAVNVARSYRRLGIRRGDRVVCSLSNRPEYFVALAAAWACGAVHVGVDYQFTSHELSSVIRLVGARALVCEPADDSSEPSPSLDELRGSHPDTLLITASDQSHSGGLITLSELLTAGTTAGADEGPPPDAPSAEDPAIIFISSGTTGKPKATIGYQGNLGQRWQRLAAWLRFGVADVHLAQMPLSHGFGLMMSLAGLLAGGRLVLLNSFSAEEALGVVGAERVTVLNGAPTHFKLILNRLDPARHDVSSLRLSVGTASAFSPELIRALWERLGVEFMFMYGSSEGVGVATTDRDDMMRGSVGRPAPGSVAVVGADRSPLPTGEVGEVAFSRKFFPVRYWSGSARGAATGGAPGPAGESGEWYYSGDLGRLDEEGRLYVFGRLKHQIDRGGLKVDPVEVEGALQRCPGVMDAAVIGLPNPVLGEVVCACVVPGPGRPPDLTQIRSALSRELASYKLPEELRIVEQIPRTRIGKVDLVRLRADFLTAARQQLAGG